MPVAPKYKIGSIEHRHWVVSCVIDAANRRGTTISAITRDQIENSRPDGESRWPHWEDWSVFGGYRKLRADLVARGADAVIHEGEVYEPTPVRAEVRPPTPLPPAPVVVVDPTPLPTPMPTPVVSSTPITAVEAPPVVPPDALEMHRMRSALDDSKRREKELLGRLDAAERYRDHVSALSADGTPIGVQRREGVFGLREATAVALASDWHIEELVDPETVGGVNAFDLSVAEHSARRYFEGLVWLLESHSQAFSIRDLVLWIGGDIISNTIHEELLESNLLSPLVATRFARELFVKGIRMLLAETNLERIIIPCNYGNHGRTTPKPRISTGASNSYEVALYHQLADDFRDEPRVQFVVSRGEILYLSIYDLTVRFTHGDAVKYGGGIGGITIPINKALAGWNTVRRADLTCMGHWHQYMSARGLIVNGSLIGYGPFSQRVKATYEPPQQAFTLIDSRRGVCQSTPIWVREDDHDPILDATATDVIKQRLLSGGAL